MSLQLVRDESALSNQNITGSSHEFIRYFPLAPAASQARGIGHGSVGNDTTIANVSNLRRSS
jgi:hypothetical protein